MSIILKIGMWALAGFLTQIVWIAYYITYSYKNIDDDKVDECVDRLLLLKLGLYKSVGINERTGRAIIDWIHGLDGVGAMLYVFISMLIWPILWVENLYALPKWLKWVRENALKTERRVS